MAQKIYPGDIVFPVDANGAYSPGSATVSPQVPVDAPLASRARAVSHMASWSVIVDIDDASAQGELSVWVTNADFETRGDGEVVFFGPVVWVQKAQSVISVGSQDVSGPFEIEVPFNCSHVMQLRYAAQGGSGRLTAKLGGVGR